jgi:hypothetical protein
LAIIASLKDNSASLEISYCRFNLLNLFHPFTLGQKRVKEVNPLQEEARRHIYYRMSWLRPMGFQNGKKELKGKTKST